MTFFCPRPVAWFWFLSAFGTCLIMGTWQVQRLAWKENLLAAIEQAKGQPAITKLPQSDADITALEFRPVTLSGSWVRGVEYHLFPRWYQGKQGYWIIAPFTLGDGRVVLVNRGWVPTEKKDPATRPETQARGYDKVAGLLRLGGERHAFTPSNRAEKNLWFARDIGEMAAAHDLKRVIPAMVDVVGTQDANHLPVPSDGTITLRNDHLSYIITWYGIAAGILVIFLVYHRKK